MSRAVRASRRPRKARPVRRIGPGRGDVGNSMQDYDPFGPLPKRRAKGRMTYAVAVGTLVAVAAFVGHYAGQNASARGVPGAEWSDVIDTRSSLQQNNALRGTLEDDVDTAPTQTFEDEVYGLQYRPEQQVEASGKGDFLAGVPTLDLAAIDDRIEPADTLTGTPTISAIEQMSLRGRTERGRRQETARRQVAEHNCMARAIYFEARGESTLGQLAVANVIINRVATDVYPDTICGVVYQNEQRRNACQFSFACDGKSDVPNNDRYWEQSQRVATQAISGGRRIYAVEGATHYHADYVSPRWARSMTMLKKIGVHIFYNDPTIDVPTG